MTDYIINIQELEKRKYYIQSYKFTMKGLLIDEEEFQISPAISRQVTMFEVDTKVRGRRVKIEPPRPNNFDLNITNFDIQKSFDAFNTVQKMAPVSKYAKGKFSTSLNDLVGTLNEKMEEYANTILKANLSCHKKIWDKIDDYVKNDKFNKTTKSQINKYKDLRKEYIDLAIKYNISIRCILMTTDMIESMFRNNKRNKIIPKITLMFCIYDKSKPVVNPTTLEPTITGIFIKFVYLLYFLCAFLCKILKLSAISACSFNNFSNWSSYSSVLPTTLFIY